MNIKRHGRRVFAVCLMTAMLLLSFIPFGQGAAVNAAALTLETPRPLSELEEYIYWHLEDWQSRLIVSEFYFGETLVLQLHLMLTEAIDRDDDLQPFIDALFTMLEANELSHDRLFLDLVDSKGVRVESFDIGLKDGFASHAIFGTDGDEEIDIDAEDNGETDVLEASHAIDQSYEYDDFKLDLTGYDFFDDENGPFVALFFDFTNLHEQPSSAIMIFEMKATQGASFLKVNESLQQSSGYSKIVRQGETVEGIVLGFYLDDPAADVAFYWMDTQTFESGTLTLPARDAD